MNDFPKGVLKLVDVLKNNYKVLPKEQEIYDWDLRRVYLHNEKSNLDYTIRTWNIRVEEYSKEGKEEVISVDYTIYKRKKSETINGKKVDYNAINVHSGIVLLDFREG
ncbi:hypothetical protein vBBceHLY2_00213 [Bacillus phage vB_BceH_LY2]|nr:hypothetical protein vBBceHLY2_00213 [Bacillus phage vB_BceH_LY2]